MALQRWCFASFASVDRSPAMLTVPSIEPSFILSPTGAPSVSSGGAPSASHAPASGRRLMQFILAGYLSQSSTSALPCRSPRSRLGSRFQAVYTTGPLYYRTFYPLYFRGDTRVAGPQNRPAKWARPISYITGWLSLIGEWVYHLTAPVKLKSDIGTPRKSHRIAGGELWHHAIVAGLH